MEKSTFIETVAVEPTKAQSDEAIIEEYESHTMNYFNSQAITELQCIKELYKKDDPFCYFNDEGPLLMASIQIVLCNIPEHIVDRHYRDLITSFRNKTDLIRSESLLRFGTKEDKSKICGYYKDYNKSICALLEFHRKRDEKYEAAKIRRSYKTIIASLKRLSNDLPNELPGNLGADRKREIMEALGKINENLGIITTNIKSK